MIDSAGNEILARLLLNRGIDSVTKIQNFLNPLKMQFTSPFVFTDMLKSVKRIKDAVNNGENITVYGDFDADGITSTSVLYKTLKEIGANVDYYLPDRGLESHGLNTKALINIISKKKSKLIITVDCGISNVDEINFANSFKADVIITDHHEAAEILPKAFSIINPKASNALTDDLTVEEIHNLSCLAGVGVVFKLCCALLEEFEKTGFVDELLPLVAVGTIADVVPLLGENRAFVKMGLSLIQEGKHLGIQKLLNNVGVEEASINSETIAFTIAPRLNAAGRLDSAERALRLLVSEDIGEIEESIVLLNDLNSLRQDLCDEIFKEAVSHIEKQPEKFKNAIVLLNENWHLGIIGIVASKLVEKYNRPAFLMTKDSSDSTDVRCSCRGISGMNIYEILSSHSEYLLKFGGHAMAAGFSFDEKVIKFEDFSALLSNAIGLILETIDITPILEIDAELNPQDVDINLIEQIEKLQPFGACNQPPVFALKDMKLSQYRFIGQNSNHLKLNCIAAQGRQFECLKWNTSDFNLPLNSMIDIAFYPKINQFNGNITVQLDLKDIKSELLNIDKSDFKILDHRKKTNILEQVIDYINNSKKQISLYIENKKTEEMFLKHDKIKSRIFNRQSIPENIEHIMFFDCPPDKDLFGKILSSTSAKTIHLMNFDSDCISISEFIKVISGMFKYSYLKKKGIINIEELAKLTNTTNKTIEIALDLFCDLEMLEVEELESMNYKIVFKSAVEFSKIKLNPIYDELEAELLSIKEYRQKIHSGDIEDLKKLLLN